MPKANQSINAFLGYPNNNIEITEKLGLLVGVKLIAPAPECMKWSTEEEAELRFQKKMSSDSWTHQHQGHRFYFEKQDGSELIAIFDRSYGFILPDEYKELMRRRSLNRSVFIDMKPTKLFLELSNVHSFKQSEALNSRSQPSKCKKKEYSIVKRPPENKFTTFVLGLKVGVSLHLPDEKSLYWQQEEGAASSSTWTIANNGVTFYFYRNNNKGPLEAVFDRACGFLTKEEYAGLQEARQLKKRFRAQPTQLYPELPWVTAVIKPLSSSSESTAMPFSSPPPLEEVPRLAPPLQFPTSAASSLAALFRQPVQKISTTEKVDSAVETEESNSTARRSFF